MGKMNSDNIMSSTGEYLCLMNGLLHLLKDLLSQGWRKSFSYYSQTLITKSAQDHYVFINFSSIIFIDNALTLEGRQINSDIESYFLFIYFLFYKESLDAYPY